MADRKVVIKGLDMREDVLQDAVETLVRATMNNTVEKKIAAQLKKEFDKRYGPTWHCIVGKHFGSFVTHEARNYVYYSINDKDVLLFKSG